MRPVRSDLPEQLSRLIRAGHIKWTGRRVAPPRVRPTLRGPGPTIADIILNDRG